MAEDARILIGEAQMAQFSFGSVNKVTLIGNLGQDPEIRHNQAGDKIATLSVATSESYKDKQGQKKEKVEWHKVVVFDDKVSDLLGRFCQKGTKVQVEGAQQTRKWTDQENIVKYSTEVVLTRFKGEVTVLSGAKGKPEEHVDNGVAEDDDIPL
jgi:single-strand DNA-binding protein